MTNPTPEALAAEYQPSEFAKQIWRTALDAFYINSHNATQRERGHNAAARIIDEAMEPMRRENRELREACEAALQDSIKRVGSLFGYHGSSDAALQNQLREAIK